MKFRNLLLTTLTISVIINVIYGNNNWSELSETTSFNADKWQRRIPARTANKNSWIPNKSQVKYNEEIHDSGVQKHQGVDSEVNNVRFEGETNLKDNGAFSPNEGNNNDFKPKDENYFVVSRNPGDTSAISKTEWNSLQDGISLTTHELSESDWKKLNEDGILMATGITVPELNKKNSDGNSKFPEELKLRLEKYHPQSLRYQFRTEKNQPHSDAVKQYPDGNQPFNQIYNPHLESYQPQSGRYLSQPESVQLNSEGYQSNPEIQQPHSERHQSRPEMHKTNSESPQSHHERHQPQTQRHQSQFESHQPQFEQGFQFYPEKHQHQSQPEGYQSHPEKHQHQSQPEGYQSQPEGYQSHPEKHQHQSQPEGYQSHPEKHQHQSQPEGYQSHPEKHQHQSQPEGYQSHPEKHQHQSQPEGYQSHPEMHQPQIESYHFHPERQHTQSEDYKSHTEGHQSQPESHHPYAEAHHLQSDGYQSHLDGHQPQPEPHSKDFQTQTDGYQPNDGRQPQLEGYNPYPEKHHSQPENHQSNLEGYQPQLEGHQPQLEGYQPQLEGHQPQLEGHQPQLEGHQPQVEGHQPRLEGQQPKLEVHQPQLEGQQPQPKPHTKGFQRQPEGYQPQLEGYQPQSEEYQSQPEGYQPQPDGYQQQPADHLPDFERNQLHPEGLRNYQDDESHANKDCTQEMNQHCTREWKFEGNPNYDQTWTDDRRNTKTEVNNFPDHNNGRQPEGWNAEGNMIGLRGWNPEQNLQYIRENRIPSRPVSGGINWTPNENEFPKQPKEVENQQWFPEEKNQPGMTNHWTSNNNGNLQNTGLRHNVYPSDISGANNLGRNLMLSDTGSGHVGGSSAGWPKGDTETPLNFVTKNPQGNYKGEDMLTYLGNGNENSIQGTPNVDYPVYTSLPNTNFDCKNYDYSGYFADLETQCQVYHVCQADGRHNSFLCPVGTIFNQKLFTCDWWFNYDCSESPNYYSLNLNLYRESDAQGNFKGYNYPGSISPWQQFYPQTGMMHQLTFPLQGTHFSAASNGNLGGEGLTSVTRIDNNKDGGEKSNMNERTVDQNQYDERLNGDGRNEQTIIKDFNVFNDVQEEHLRPDYEMRGQNIAVNEAWNNAEHPVNTEGSMDFDSRNNFRVENTEKWGANSKGTEFWKRGGASEDDIHKWSPNEENADSHDKSWISRREDGSMWNGTPEQNWESKLIGNNERNEQNAGFIEKDRNSSAQSEAEKELYHQNLNSKIRRVGVGFNGNKENHRFSSTPNEGGFDSTVKGEEISEGKDDEDYGNFMEDIEDGTKELSADMAEEKYVPSMKEVVKFKSRDNSPLDNGNESRSVRRFGISSIDGTRTTIEESGPRKQRITDRKEKSITQRENKYGVTIPENPESETLGTSGLPERNASTDEVRDIPVETTTARSHKERSGGSHGKEKKIPEMKDDLSKKEVRTFGTAVDSKKGNTLDGNIRTRGDRYHAGMETAAQVMVMGSDISGEGSISNDEEMVGNFMKSAIGSRREEHSKSNGKSFVLKEDITEGMEETEEKISTEGADYVVSSDEEEEESVYGSNVMTGSAPGDYDWSEKTLRNRLIGTEPPVVGVKNIYSKEDVSRGKKNFRMLDESTMQPRLEGSITRFEEDEFLPTSRDSEEIYHTSKDSLSDGKTVGNYNPGNKLLSRDRGISSMSNDSVVSSVFEDRLMKNRTIAVDLDENLDRNDDVLDDSTNNTTTSKTVSLPRGSKSRGGDIFGTFSKRTTIKSSVLGQGPKLRVRGRMVRNKEKYEALNEAAAKEGIVENTSEPDRNLKSDRLNRFWMEDKDEKMNLPQSERRSGISRN